MVALIEALPDLPVGQAGEEPITGCEECVGHRLQRVRQAAVERLPGFAAAPSVDTRLRVSAAVGGVRAGTRRYVPAFGVLRIDGDRPRVVSVAALVCRLPALATVFAEGGAATSGLVGPPRRRGCQASECTSGCAPGR